MSDKEKLIEKLSDSIKVTSSIDNELFVEYNVKRGLRNADHTGVLVGLTKIGSVIGYLKKDDGTLESVDGNLFYRGINIKDIVKGVQASGYPGFDETVYLLLSGKLPKKENLDTFTSYLADLRDLPQEFTQDIILSLKGKDLMNMLSRAVMGLYVFDEDADSTDRENLMKQSLNLIAKFPTIIAYSYQSMMHGYYHKTLSIRHPKPGLSTAENFLYMLKGPDKYTKLDAEILDLSLILHAEHGGGNNSSFTIRVTSSSGTDTYSAVTAAIGSLKGPLHGGANLRVQGMMAHLKKEIKNWQDDYEIKNYLIKILKKEAYNKSGKIYGIGHAIYTKSDPRAILLKDKARDLAIEKGRLEEFEFYEAIERMAPVAFAEFKGEKASKVLCANVDFYSGLVYEMIGIPEEIYTPLFAMSRIAGWTAHRIEELNFDSKRIIRPAYRNVGSPAEYIQIEKR